MLLARLQALSAMRLNVSRSNRAHADTQVTPANQLWPMPLALQPVHSTLPHHLNQHPHPPCLALSCRSHHTTRQISRRERSTTRQPAKTKKMPCVGFILRPQKVGVLFGNQSLCTYTWHNTLCSAQRRSPRQSPNPSFNNAAAAGADPHAPASSRRAWPVPVGAGP